MIGHFTRLALKAFLRFKVHSLIGLVSLVLGFSCLLLAKLLVSYLGSFDRHFPGSDRIYSVVQYVEGEDISVEALPIVSRPVAEHLRVDFPELERVARASWPQTLDFAWEDRTGDVRARFVSDGFLEMFPLPMAHGIGAGQHLPPDSVIISERAARRIFGTADAVGQRLRLWHEFEVSIVGVWRTMDAPSHIESALPLLSSDLIGPIAIYDRWDDRDRSSFYEDPAVDQWNDQSYLTFIQFPPGRSVEVESFRRQLAAFGEKHLPRSREFTRSFSIQPIEQLALSAIRSIFQGLDVIALLRVTGYLVLVIACLNYSNLVVAQLSARGQEIGLQKILGARRGLLILQYCYECLLFVAAALLVTVIVVLLSLNALENAGVPGVNGALLLKASLWSEVLIAVIVVVAVAGAYPAIQTLRASLVTLLRPKGSSAYSGRLRAFMVATQFMISCTLIIVSVVMIQQNASMREQLDGDVADPKIVVTVPLSAVDVDAEVLERELTRHPAIVSAARVERLPWSFGTSNLNLSSSSDLSAPVTQSIVHRVSHNFFQALGVPIRSGRAFMHQRANDVVPPVSEALTSPGPYAIIIDEQLAADLGWRHAPDAVGQRIYMHLEPPQVRRQTILEFVVEGIAGRPPFQIINYAGFGMSGHAYLLQPYVTEYLIVRAAKGEEAAALAHMDDVWSSLLPGVLLQRRFVDELFYDAYRIFLQLSSAIIGLSLFGFFIATIGLVGNATFITTMRQKEVGIRKVMGAKTSRLVAMLLFDFARPVIIANVVAWPLGYLLARGYVSLFTVQAPITVQPFLISLLVSVMIACVAVLAQSYRTARVRPATILRYE